MKKKKTKPLFDLGGVVLHDTPAIRSVLENLISDSPVTRAVTEEAIMSVLKEPLLQHLRHKAQEVL